MDVDMEVRDHGGYFLRLVTLIRNGVENCSTLFFGKPSVVLWVFIYLSSLNVILMGTSRVVV